jgi:uncharacterized protein involved in outer membrane biogenesis
MKKFLRWAAAIIVLLLLLVTGVVIFMDQIVKGVAERRIRAQTGMEARIGELHIKFGAASLRIKDFKLLNPPEFGPSPLLSIPELAMQLDRDAARLGKLRFKEIRFHLSEFNLVKNHAGQFNVQGLEKIAATNGISSGGTHKNGKSFEFGGIEKMYLTLGKLKYTDLAKPDHNEVLDLEVENELVQNLQTEKEFKTWYGAFCVRLVLQVLTQQMINNPDHTQSFEGMLKELGNSIQLF